MFCKKFGIECKAEVSNGGAPRNNGMLKLGLGRAAGRTQLFTYMAKRLIVSVHHRTTNRLSKKNFSMFFYIYICRTQRPLDLRRGSAAPRLLGLRVRIPSEHGCWSVVSGVCCQAEVAALVW